MKVHLRQAATGCYYWGHSLWVRDRSGAVDFENIGRASALIQAEQWNGMEIILAYDTPLCDLVLPHNPLEYR